MEVLAFIVGRAVTVEPAGKYDPRLFIPERFLGPDQEKQVKVGVYANL